MNWLTFWVMYAREDPAGLRGGGGGGGGGADEI